jgi:hypothetical protein
MDVELHFQDGFSGETVEVLVNGEVRAAFSAKTRYQINLAHMEPVRVKLGDLLSIRVKDSPVSIEMKVETDQKYYVISRREHALFVERTNELPKYM